MLGFMLRYKLNGVLSSCNIVSYPPSAKPFTPDFCGWFAIPLRHAGSYMKRNRFWSVFALAWVTAVSSASAVAETLREAVEQAVSTSPEVLESTNHRLAAD